VKVPVDELVDEPEDEPQATNNPDSIKLSMIVSMTRVISLSCHVDEPGYEVGKS
jgi:hypothetical protein